MLRRACLCMPALASRRRLAIALVAITVALGPCRTLAEEPLTEADLVKALTGKATRGVVAGDATKAAEEKALIESLLGRDTRAITVEERAKVAEIAKSKPSVDLEITFAFNSAEIGPRAEPALLALGKALADPGLAGATFLVAGHTDGKGSAAYNLALSEKRAAAVKRYLIAEFRLSEARLLALGYGFERLKNAADPAADENRRVQVVNLVE